jgi:hypothetical protein
MAFRRGFGAFAVLALGLTPAAWGDYLAPSYEPAGARWPQAAAICGGTPNCMVDKFAGGPIVETYRGGMVDYSTTQYGGADGIGETPLASSSGGYYAFTLGTPGGIDYFDLWFSALGSAGSFDPVSEPRRNRGRTARVGRRPAPRAPSPPRMNRAANPLLVDLAHRRHGLLR